MGNENSDSPDQEESVTATIETANEILAIEVSTSDLGLNVLGTITNGDKRKVLLKNPVTGELGSYFEGERIDIVSSEPVKVVEISKCIILIERAGKYETMECNNKMPTVVFNGPGALSKYKIVRKWENDLSILSHKFITDYDKDIMSVSAKHDVDPYLVKAVIKAESNFDPSAVSHKNAQGIMQLIPETASDYGVDNPFDAKENMDGGVQYLSDLLNYFDGDLKLSLAAYNAGKGAVIKHGFTIPPYPETTEYITKVLGYYKILKSRSYGPKNSLALKK
jgi:transglycosylase-like protein with SLT domain